jgi:hypothetical protein
MKYKEPEILLKVRKIKEQLHAKMKTEGEDAFFERINRRAGRTKVTAKRKLVKKAR